MAAFGSEDTCQKSSAAVMDLQFVEGHDFRPWMLGASETGTLTRAHQDSQCVNAYELLRRAAGERGRGIDDCGRSTTPRFTRPFRFPAYNVPFLDPGKGLP
jgi:hypothetical protein